MIMIRLEPYTSDFQSQWNELVTRSKNGTFLLDRRFMDYHSHRFTDCSLLFFRGSRLVACLPANYVQSEQTVYSHQGLTYGGLIMDDSVGSVEVMQMFSLFRDDYRNTLGATRMIYIQTPYISHRQASEEPLYALFRNDASLVARGLSTSVNLSQPIPLQARRRSGVRKGIEHRLVITETTDRKDYQEFWDVVNKYARIFVDTPKVLIDLTLKAYNELSKIPGLKERNDFAMNMLREEVLPAMETVKQSYNPQY